MSIRPAWPRPQLLGFCRFSGIQPPRDSRGKFRFAHLAESTSDPVSPGTVCIFYTVVFHTFRVSSRLSVRFDLLTQFTLRSIEGL